MNTDYCYKCGKSLLVAAKGPSGKTYEANIGHFEKVNERDAAFCDECCPACHPTGEFKKNEFGGYDYDPEWQKGGDGKQEQYDKPDGGQGGDGDDQSQYDSGDPERSPGGGDGNGEDSGEDSDGDGSGDGEQGEGEGEGEGEGALTNTERAKAALRALEAYVQTPDFDFGADRLLSEAAVRQLAADLMHLADRTTTKNEISHFGQFGRGMEAYQRQVKNCEEGDWKVVDS